MVTMKKTTAIALLAVLFLSGCGPSLTPEDLGEVMFRVPEVTNSEREFPLPELPPPTAEPFNPYPT